MNRLFKCAMILAGLGVSSGEAGLAASDAAHDDLFIQTSPENLQQVVDFIPPSSEDVQLASVGAVLGGAFGSAAHIPKVLEWSSAVMLTAAAAAWGLWKAQQIQQGESLAAPVFYSGLKENFIGQRIIHKEHASLLEHIQKQGPEEELKLLAWMEDQEEGSMSLLSQKVKPNAETQNTLTNVWEITELRFGDKDTSDLLVRYFNHFRNDVRVRQKIASGHIKGLSWERAIKSDIKERKHAVKSEEIKELLYAPLQEALEAIKAGSSSTHENVEFSKEALAHKKVEMLKMIHSSGSGEPGEYTIENSFSGPLPGVMRYLKKIADLTSFGKIYTMFPAQAAMSSEQQEYVESLQKWYNTFGDLFKDLDGVVDIKEMQGVMNYYIRLAQAKAEAAAGG